jgi:signal transduction histidine kinase/DNA-binding NarL/FixJ family response regulator/HPt (histidine-containing phosphotransfer) domain-containing protein
MQTFAVPLRRSIRLHLSLVIAAVIFLAVMGASAANSWRELKQSADARAQLLEAAASGFSASIAEPLAQHDTRGVYEALRGVRDLNAVQHVGVTDADGAMFAQLGAAATLRNRTRDLRDLSGLALLGADNATVRRQIIKANQPIGEMVILADISDLRGALMTGMMWTALASLIAIAVTRPIRDLAAVMADVGAKQDFSRRVAPSKRKDETAVLGEAFNDMIANIRVRDDKLARHMETLEQTVEERTHDLRIAKEDAESANAAKSDFLATMSHEIRTPMNGMMVMAEMLAAADLSTRHRRYAEIISRSGAGLLTIINDILDLSKIEAGKLDLEAVPFSPDALVEDIATLFWERARSKNLELAIHVAPEVPRQVVGDPTRFNQVVTNLVNNALKFTEQGGVAIGVRALTEGELCRLEVAVRDTGVGIDKSRIGSIFEAFSQADQTTTRRFGGTGLGLTVCKRLVDAMGGEIRVDSEPGQGSTFTVSVAFPVDEAAPEAPRARSMAIAVAMKPGLSAQCLQAALWDLGCGVRMLASPAEARPGEIVLSPSDMLAAEAAPSALNVCLSDVGDNRVDVLLRNRTAVDLLPLPVGRRALWEFVHRAAQMDFRGVGALAASQVARERESFAGLSVLAVDDNAVNREVLREALLTLDVEADFVANGQEAVDAAKAKRYDVIFMDGSMPVMDGFEATRQIRHGEAGHHAMIVALTAQVRGADADEWAKAGADRHMTKPFTAARLVDALKAARGGAAPVMVEVKPEAPRATSLIDEEAVTSMEQVGARNGRDVLGKVWKLFLGQAPKAAGLIATSTEAYPVNGGDLSKTAHALKSMSLSAGAEAIGRLCEDVEHSAKDGRLEHALKRCEELPALLADTCREIEARLQKRAAA